MILPENRTNVIKIQEKRWILSQSHFFSDERASTCPEAKYGTSDKPVEETQTIKERGKVSLLPLSLFTVRIINFK
ncbi:MAG: hypothetical protein J6T28_04410 [Paludibacteraceae bacterium]|nr:hypothetical protein [Paludibacteraceae bacterium]MBP5481031.1 hypothetical protein [Paludibacteraceae bacterium]